MKLDETKRQKIIHPIPPLYDKDSKILILGSFPSVKSREEAFFYGHKQNRFWKLLAGILSEKKPETVEEKKDFLSELLARMNDLFGLEVTDGDKLDWVQGMVSKLSENGPLMEQVRNNPRESILHGDFPNAVDEAVIGRMETQQGMSLTYLSHPDKARALQNMLLDLLLEGLAGHQSLRAQSQ